MLLKVVVKLGGHVFPMEFDVKRFSKYVQVLKNVKSEGHRLIVVTGGGSLARRYIDNARRLGANETMCDMIGIEGTRLNTRLLIAGLGEAAYPSIPNNFQDIAAAFASEKIVVLGGMYPSQSTDAVAALISEFIGANILIKATDTDGIYTADPKKDPTAEKIDEISCDRLLEMFSHRSLTAGEYRLFDPVALQIVNRSKICTWVIDGRKPENIERVLRGERIGTIVTSS